MCPAILNAYSAATDVADIAKYSFAIYVCKISILCTVHLSSMQQCSTKHFFICILSDFSSGLLSRNDHLIFRLHNVINKAKKALLCLTNYLFLRKRQIWSFCCFYFSRCWWFWFIWCTFTANITTSASTEVITFNLSSSGRTDSALIKPQVPWMLLHWVTAI